MSRVAELPMDPHRRHWYRSWLIIFGVVVIAGLLGGMVGLWYLTAALDDHEVALPIAAPPAVGSIEAPPALVTWPEGTLAGEPAKVILLDLTRRALARVDRMSGYTATFRREERVKGVLGPEIVADMKVRNHPFAIYLKYQTVRPGKEVVYAEGHHDNKVIAHNGDWTRKLIPRLAVEPTSPLALADSRHPITDAGLLNLCRKLLKFRELDLGEVEATTVLDRVTLSDGRSWLRSTHDHSKRDDGRPFYHVVILYDPTTQLPYQISSYDWPAPNDTGPLQLAERYTYEDLHLDVPLTQLDFDPRNPAYAFLRF